MTSYADQFWHLKQIKMLNTECYFVCSLKFPVYTNRYTETCSIVQQHLQHPR